MTEKLLLLLSQVPGFKLIREDVYWIVIADGFRFTSCLALEDALNAAVLSLMKEYQVKK